MDGIIDNLTSAINTWNSKLAEIWLLLTESPETFKGGDIWKIIVKVHEGLQAIGLALLVLFFVWGLIRTCTIPKPKRIIPIARMSPNIKSLKLLITVTGSLAA